MKMSIFASTVLANLLLASLTALSQEQVQAPAFRDGDFWQFKVTEKGFIGSSSETGDAIIEVAYAQGDIKIFRVLSDRKEEYDRKAPIPVRPLLELSKEHIDLKFPFAVGQKWDYEYTFRPRGAKRDNRVSVEIQVKGSESVTTPAGSFIALRMHKDESWARPQGGHVSQVTTYFYSAQTRSVVKSLMESQDGARREIELIKYGALR